MCRHRQGLRLPPALLFLGLLLCACAHGGSLPQVDKALAPDARDPPTPASFVHCSGHGCKTAQPLSLNEAEWSFVTAPLAFPPASAAAEREALAQVAARFEQVTGPKAGTAGDLGGTKIFLVGGQLDCVDEAINTTRLLNMLYAEDLLRFHTPRWPVHRSFVGNSRTHMTAALLERGNGAWAVDSWFHDNGRAAEVVPLDLWLAGWEPPAGS